MNDNGKYRTKQSETSETTPKRSITSFTPRKTSPASLIPLQDWEEHARMLYCSLDPIHQATSPLRQMDMVQVFSTKDIQKAISKLKNHKAADQYGLRAEYLKALQDTQFAQVVTEIYNRVISDGHFPKSWSEAVAQPLHKSASKLLKDNYRYIMLVTMVYKVYATTINAKITPFLHTKNQMFQAGFKKKHSCAHHILTMQIVVE